jgi:transcriptional antiterminator NusG
MDQKTDQTNQNTDNQVADQDGQVTPVVPEKTAEEQPEKAVEQTENQAEEKKEEEADEETVIVINKDVAESAHWYVVHTYSGHESKVAVTLKERVVASGHSDKVFKIFVPHQQKIVVAEGKKRSVDEKLFPGYLMILMTMNDESWYIVRSTPGVTGFVGMGSEPTPLPESEVRTLMKFAKMEAPKFEAKFRAGDSVKVNDGPFKDFLGKVDEVNEEQGKVRVLVSVFGRETPLELDFAQVSQL